MNDIHSSADLKYHPRWLASQLRWAVERHPVVVLSGARQVGKSTLLRHEAPFSAWRYLTLDDFDVLAQANAGPQGLWAGSDRIVIDEVQKSPRLLEAVKQTVDQSRGKRFILSGSANLNLMKQVSESLAGRAVYLMLHPMMLGEIQNLAFSNILDPLFASHFPKERSLSSGTTPHTGNLMWKGLMPRLMDFEDDRSVLQWWDGYVMSYLERDLRQLSQIESLTDFRRLMGACALRCSRMINQTEIARDIGISQSTVHRYLNLLESTCLMTRIPAFAVNRSKRLMKSPKLMWLDPGLISFLSGYFDPGALMSSSHAGYVFESLVFLHLHVLAQSLTPMARIYYWRTSTGKEVDFVLEWGQRLLAVEVKLSERPRYQDISHLRLFIQEYPETAAGLLIYTGDEIRRMDERIIALPWTCLNGMDGG